MPLEFLDEPQKEAPKPLSGFKTLEPVDEPGTPLTPDELRQGHREGWLAPTNETIDPILAEENKPKGLGETAWDFTKGAVKGLGHGVADMAKAGYKAADLAFNPTNDASASGTAVEGGRRAVGQFWGDLVPRGLEGLRNLQSKIGYLNASRAMGVDPSTLKQMDQTASQSMDREHYLTKLALDQQAQQAQQEQQTPTKLATFLAGGDPSKINMQTAQDISPIADPMFLAGLAPAAKALATGVGKDALKEAALKAATGSTLPEAAATTLAQGAEDALAGVKRVASKPRRMVADAIKDNPVAQAVTGAAGSAAQMAGIPVAQVAGALGTAEGGAAAGQAAANFAKGAAKEMPGQYGRFEGLSRNSQIPIWQKKVASLLTSAGADTAAGVAGSAAGGAAHGAAFGAGLGALTSDNAEQFGESVGAGAGMGSVGGLVGHALTGPQRYLDGKARDVANYALKMQERHKIDPTDLITKTDPNVLANASAVHKLFEGNVDVQVVDGPTYKAASTDPNSSGFYDAGTRTFMVNADSKRPASDTFWHEFQHAVWDQGNVDKPAIKARFDELLGPSGIKQARYDYAKALMPGASVKDRLAFIRAKEEAGKASPTSGGDPNDWVYQELWAEAGPSSFGGKNLKLDVLGTPTVVAAGLDKAKRFLEAFGVEFTPKLGEASTEIFPRFRTAIQDPGLRKMAYDYAKARNEFLSGVHKPADIETRVTKQMVGTHAGVPVWMKPDGTIGNDFVQVGKGGNVRILRPKEIEQMEKARIAEMQAAMANLTPAPPTGGLDPATTGQAPANPAVADIEVRPRVTIGGKPLATGSKLGKWFYDLKLVPDATKDYARGIEQAIQGGNVTRFWYQARGTGQGANYAASVKNLKGNFIISQREGLPVAIHAGPEGVRALYVDLSTAVKKMADWQARHKLDALWGGNAADALADLHTYLKNLGEGRSGDTGLGEKKQNALNSFVIGGNKQFADANPLRAALSGKDKEGILRTFRIDRTFDLQDTGQTSAFNYARAVLNQSPEVYHGTPHEIKDRFSLDKVGTGEGNQTYGWGLYFAEHPKVAEQYRENLAINHIQKKLVEHYGEGDDAFAAVRDLLDDPKSNLNEGERNFLKVLQDHDWLGYDYPHQAVKEAIKNPEDYDLGPEVEKASKALGFKYKIDLNTPEETFLQWDKPFSEQTPEVQKALSQFPGIDPSEPVGSAYKRLEKEGVGENQTLRKQLQDEQTRLSPLLKSLGEEKTKAVWARDQAKFEAADGQYQTVFAAWQKLERRLDQLKKEFPKQFAQHLASLGINGVKYLDGVSRNKGEGTYNYVMFTDKPLKAPERVVAQP